ncbi:MAG: hypothetical protein MI921_19480 [Cytophagales bacterium]|nr:hypothetical protein [Cytophagales bacterium]
MHNLRLAMNTSVLQFVQDNIPDDLKNPGLFTGNSGAALLFGELYKYSGKPIYRSKAYDYLQLSLDQLDPMDTSLARGITGVAYTINHLFNHGVLEQSDFLPDLDNLIIESLQVDMYSEMYDYFMDSSERDYTSLTDRILMNILPNFIII